MSLASAIVADAAMLVSPADFGEAVRVREEPGAAARSVYATVNRQPVDDAEDTQQPYPGRRAPVIHVALRNHATLGMAAAAVRDNVSEVAVAYPLGGDARWRRVLRIVRHNPGVVVVEVQS